MRRILMIAVAAVALGSVAAAETSPQTTTPAAPKPMSATDYFRQHAADSSSSSSTSTAGMPGAITTSCKALSDQGPIPADIARDDLLKRATDAGCRDDEIAVLMQVYDMTHGY